MKKPIEEFLVAVDQRIEFMGKCEYHMEIRGIDHFCPAFIYPEFLIDSLAVGAAAVTAGIMMDFNVAAVRTLGKVAAELTGFAVQDSKGGFALDI